MMTEVALFDALRVLVADRVYPSIAAQGTPHPYIVVTAVAATPDTAICGSTEDAERLYQIDIYHENSFDLITLRRQVFAALQAMPQCQSIDGWMMDFETDTRLHRCMLTARLYEHAADLP